MKHLPGISEAEWEVMRVVWAVESITANEVVKALEPNTPWKRRTIRTLINRLVDKGALGFEKQGRSYRYHALVDETECMQAENESFLKRVYGGMTNVLISNFIEETELSDAEIDELQQKLEKARRRQ